MCIRDSIGAGLEAAQQRHLLAPIVRTITGVLSGSPILDSAGDWRTSGERVGGPGPSLALGYSGLQLGGHQFASFVAEATAPSSGKMQLFELIEMGHRDRPAADPARNRDLGVGRRVFCC